MSGFTCTIAGVDVSTMFDPSQLDCEIITSRKNSTATFYLYDSTLAFRCNPLDEVVLGWNGTTFFSGVATQPNVYPESATYNKWEIVCQDDFYYLDSTIVNEAYTNQTADYIIKDIISKYLTGITTNNVQPGVNVSYVIFSHRTITQCLQKLAKLATADPIIYYVDSSDDLHWSSLTQLPDSGILISDSDSDIAAGAVTFERTGAEYLLDGTQITNNVIVRGGMALSSSYTDTFAADGHQTSFALAYTPSQQNGAVTPSLTVGGVSTPVNIAGSGGSGWTITNQIPGSSTLVTGTSSLTAPSAPANGTLVALTYNFDLPIIVRAKSNASITKYNKVGSKTKGVHATAITDQTLRTMDAAQARAQSTLLVNSFHLQTAKLTIPENYTGPMIQVGSIVHWTCTQLGVSNLAMAVIDNHIKGTQALLRRQELTLEV